MLCRGRRARARPSTLLAQWSPGREHPPSAIKQCDQDFRIFGGVALKARKGLYFFLRRAAKAAAAPAPSTASVAGSGTGELPPEPGGAGGHQEGTNRQVAPAIAGGAARTITPAKATNVQITFLMDSPHSRLK